MRLRSLLGIAIAVLSACSSFGSSNDSSPSGPNSGDDGGAGVDGSGPNVTGSTPIMLTFQAPPLFKTGASNNVQVSVVRDGPTGFTGRVNVALANLPNVTAKPISIPADQQTAEMTIDVDAYRKNGQTSFELDATSPDNGGKGSATFSTLVRGDVGTLDTGFGTDGFFTLPDASDSATLLSGPSGALYVAGKLGSDLGVVALKDDGSIDTTFGTMGVLRQNVPNLLYPYAVNMDGANFLFYSNFTSGPSGVVRVTPTGLDPTFGANGVATIPGLVSGRAVSPPPSPQPNLAIVAGRPVSDNASSTVMLISTSTGAVDASWPAGGRMAVTSTCGTGGAAVFCGVQAMASEPKNSTIAYQCVNQFMSAVVAVGSVASEDAPTTVAVGTSCSDLIVAPGGLYTAGQDPNGARIFRVADLATDTTFYGKPPTALQGAAPRRILAQGDGSLVVSFEIGTGTNVNGIGVWRLDSSGHTDVAFGPPNGYAFAGIPNSMMTITSMMIDSQGRILVAGYNGHMFVARFWQ